VQDEYYNCWYKGEEIHPMEKIIIKANEYGLKGRLYNFTEKSKSQPILIFFNPWMPGNISWSFSDLYARCCSKKYGLVCMTAAFRGMGSGGDIKTLTRSDFLDDAKAVYDFAANLDGIDHERISVAGESFGSYMSCLLSTARPIKNLILRVPTDFPKEGFYDVPQVNIAGNLSRGWKMKRHSPEESFALEAIHNFKNNIFIIESEKDEFIPHQTIENYLAAAPERNHVEYHLLKNASHGLSIKLYEYIKILYGIIDRYEF
jgi:Dipeptidyl aminopeptidases/acylaminoacyl-peptidases